LGILLVGVGLGIPLGIFAAIMHLIWSFVLLLIGAHFITKYFFGRKSHHSGGENVEFYNSNGEKFQMSVVFDEDGNPKAQMQRVD
jgi:hypothetical protein